MSYVKTTWSNGATPLSAENMNHIEDGIEALDTGKVDKVTGKGLSTNDYTTAEKNKLAGVAAGAEVNVQSDWNQSTTTADDYIKNKPTNATTSSAGFMSAADKTKLNGIATGAEVNQNAFSNVKVGSTTIQADGKTDTLELVAGDNVTLTPDATNDKVTISMTDFIVAEGTDNTNTGGYYRKWASGVSEYWWGWTSASFAPSGSAGGFYARRVGPFSFPSGLFIEKPKTFFNLDTWGTGWIFGNARSITKDEFHFSVFRSDNAASEGEGSVYAIGKWK